MRARLLATTAVAVFTMPALGADWPEWRGPLRDGRSEERGLPASWSPSGEGLAWKAPYGGRSTPIVLGDRLFIQSPSGQGETRQERVACLDANTGRLIWQYTFNVYLSDVPPHRVGWASPAGDPQTGVVYSLGVGGHLVALSRDGKPQWERSLTEDFGLVTTHGGRTGSPVIEGDLVIVNGITSGWGDQARGSHRFLAFDKKTGETVWVASPGGRPFDTTYSPPVVAVVDGVRLLIAGGSDGNVHALKPATGELQWSIPISKHGVNTGAVLKGNTVFVSHSEENLDSSEMGLLEAVDATGGKGPLAADRVKWKDLGFQGGFSSPVLDGTTLFQVDNGANLFAFDAETGKRLWEHNLGTIQKASTVLADGKLYVGSNNGRFFILKPGPSGVEVLDEDSLGTESAPEEIWASVAVAHGRVYLATMDALYAIGKKGPLARPFVAKSAPPAATTPGEPAYLQVRPGEVLLKPGETAHFKARLYDAQGRFVREEPGATFSVDPIKVEMKGGDLQAPEGPRPQAGTVKASFGALSGTARVRVFPPLPNFVSFDWYDKLPAPWVNATGKFELREEGPGKVLVKLADNAFTKRARAFVGPATLHDYTAAVDVRAKEQRRQMGDAGVVAQRHALVLFGNSQRLELESWQPETKRTASVPFAWKADTWYRLKLRVENLAGGGVRARGKAWPSAEPEPQGWLLDRTDPIGNRQGSPGVYADAPFEVFFDNLSVVPNDEKLAEGRREPGLFAYDASLATDLQDVGSESRGTVKVRDVTYASLAGGRTAAYLVEGLGAGPHPALLCVHWYDPRTDTSNRTEFVAEAVGLAERGVTSLHVETPWSKTDWFEKRDAGKDLETSVSVVKDLRRALDVLLAQKDVDKARVAYVGHDFGAMYGAVLAGVDRRVSSFVLMAGTASFPDWFLYSPPRVGEARKAFVAQMQPVEPAAYAADAAPAALYFQFGTSDPHVFRERADAFFTMASQPKRVDFYAAGHALDERARADRLAWLEERLKLGPK